MCVQRERATDVDDCDVCASVKIKVIVRLVTGNIGPDTGNYVIME